MGLLDDVVGTLLIGSWLNLMLFMVEVTELIKYTKRFPSDSVVIKTLLALMVLVDTGACINACAMVYLYAITNWGVLSFLEVQNVTIPIYATTTGLSTVCMHFFLIYRFYRLSKGTLKQYVYVPFLGVLALTAWAGNIHTVYSVIHLTALSDRPKLATSVTWWLTAAAVTDASIALSLIWELGQLRGATVYAESRSLLSRLIGRAIVTGSVTAILAIVTLVSYLAKPTANICLTTALCIGRVCTITVLANLNSRRSAKESGVSEEFSMERSITGGITLTKQTVVRVDGVGDAPMNRRMQNTSHSPSPIDEHDADSCKQELV